MQRLLRRSILALLPAMLSALVFSMSAGASDPGLQSTAFSCNDGTRLNLALEPTALSALSEAVAAINLYLADDPALACSLSPTAPGSGNPQYDYAVGAGYRVVDPSINAPAHFALSAHEGPNGVSGTYNSMSDAPALNFDGAVTCLFVQGNQAIVGGVSARAGPLASKALASRSASRTTAPPATARYPTRRPSPTSPYPSLKARPIASPSHSSSCSRVQ